MSKICDAIIGLSIGVVIFSVLCICYTESQKTPEEKAADEAAYQEYLASYTYHYEVVSVNQYTHYTTNKYGAITGQDQCYSFTYIDHDGSLKTGDCFLTPNDYQLTSLRIGDKNEYVYEDYGHRYRYLYLARETLNNLSAIS